MTQINPRWPYGDGEMAGRIRDLDWSATLLGPVAGWSDRLRMLVEQALASPLVSTLVCGPHHLLIYNDAAAQHFGDHHPAALGRPLPEAFPEGWETVAPHYARAFGGETVRVAGQPLDTRGEGRSTDVFDALLTPMRESDGHIAYVHMTGAEVGDRARIEAALRDSEERYRSVFETLSQAYCEGQVIRSADGKAVDIRYLELNPAWGRFTGVPSSEALGRLAREVTPGIEDWWIETAGRVAATGIAEQVEHELMALDSWFGVSIHPRPGDRYVAIFDDITNRKRQESNNAVLADIGVDLALLVSPDEIIEAVGTRLGRSLHLSGCIFADVDEAKNEATIHHGWNTADVASLRQTFRLADYFGEEFRRAGRAGETIIVRDTARDQRANAEAYARLRLGSFVTVPFLRQGRWVANITATTRAPRNWHDQDIKLLQEIASRVFPRIERSRAEAAQRESEERFQQFSEASPDILWSRNAETLQWDYLSPAFETVYGLSRDEALNGNNLRRWLRLVLPDERHDAMAAMRRVREGELVTFEYRIRRLSDGQVRWIRSTDFPIRDQAGRVHRLGGVGQDITELKASEAALTHSEQRLRTLVEGMSQLVWRAIDNGDWTWASPQWTTFTGQAEPDSHHLGWLAPVHPDDREAALAAWAHALQTGGFAVEFRIRNVSTGEFRWFQTRAKPVRDVDGQITEWLGTSTDIHDLREMQERQQVLVAELQHRTRNLIGVVRATAESTMRSSIDLADFRVRYRDRLGALARVQALLARLEGLDRITFDELIRSELRAVGAIDGKMDKVTLDGPPDVALRSSTVQTFALALHELATNAVKYGALSQPSGKLAVTWRFEPAAADGRPWLHVDWTESGVLMPPTGAAPQGSGQGRQLIERALPYQLGAKTTYVMGSDGVQCSISVPVSSRTAAEEADDPAFTSS